MVKLEDALQSNKFSSSQHKAGLNILYTAWWLKTKISRELKELGLTHEQYNVMRILKGMHPEKMCVKDIGGRMIEQNSNVPRIVDKLVAKKLTLRTTSLADKRETVINLTTSGINLLNTANEQVEIIIRKSILITEADAKLLNSLLEAFRAKD